MIAQEIDQCAQLCQHPALVGVIKRQAGKGRARHQFEVNVYGPVAVIHALLPYMRKRRSGHILNITSMGWTITMPGIAFCHGSQRRLSYSGKQAGDPEKAAAAMRKLVASDNPPAHLLLGGDAVSLEKLGLLKTEFDAWEQICSSADFE